MKKDLLIILLLILPSVSWLVQPGYFAMHDDMQSIRQFQLDKCFIDLQIPCRWVPDLGYGYGYPLFNYYPPLPYLVGQLYRWTGAAYIDVVKLVGITGFITTAVFMYLLSREFWGRRGGLVSAAFYTYAPYHSVDYYVRGAANEFWAMAFFPAIFWTTYRLIKSTKNTGAKNTPGVVLNTSGVAAWTPPRWTPWVAFSVAGLMLSHNPMLMIFAPALLAWCLFWIIRLRAPRSFLTLGLSAAWALGLAAFFTLPVLFESKFVSLWTLTSGYFNYLAHFLDIKQIFLNINWGYGSSELGPGDSMSFALGYLHWLIPAAILILTPFVKKLRDHKYLILFLVSCILGSLFLAHSKATPIWLVIKPLEFLQFPWRFLTLAVFCASFLSGALGLIPKRLLLSCSFTLLLLLNANYFRPRAWYPDMTDAQKFSGQSWQLLVTSGIFDYLPVWAPQPPADPAGSDLGFVAGEGTFTRLAKRSNYQAYRLDVASPAATVELQTYYFPGWRVWVDGVEQGIDPSRDKLLGRIQVDLASGQHNLIARFTDTPIRTLGNLLSMVSWAGIGIMIVWTRRLPSVTST